MRVFITGGAVSIMPGKVVRINLENLLRLARYGSRVFVKQISVGSYDTISYILQWFRPTAVIYSAIVRGSEEGAENSSNPIKLVDYTIVN